MESARRNDVQLLQLRRERVRRRRLLQGVCVYASLTSFLSLVKRFCVYAWVCALDFFIGSAVDLFFYIYICTSFFSFVHFVMFLVFLYIYVQKRVCMYVCIQVCHWLRGFAKQVMGSARLNDVRRLQLRRERVQLQRVCIWWACALEFLIGSAVDLGFYIYICTFFFFHLFEHLVMFLSFMSRNVCYALEFFLLRYFAELRR